MKNFIIIAAFLCAGIVTSTVFGEERNILVVLDTSGSMNDRMRSVRKSRMEVAQNALIDVLSKLPPNTNIGVYSFRGWEYELQPLDKVRLAKAVISTKPSGGTPLYQALKDSATTFLEFREGQANTGSYKIIVITDGAAGDESLNRDKKYRDGSPKPGVLKDIMLRGIVVDTIGLDIKGNHALKNLINGLYMKGDDPNSLKQSLNKAVAEVAFTQNSDEFDEIAELSTSFALAAIQGLTNFQNHPIGEKPPISVINKDGTIQKVSQETEDGSWLIIVAGSVFSLFVVFFIFKILFSVL